MSCPHLKEVVMLFCRAYPVKKMVPLDRIASADPCLGQGFSQCPVFQELTARLQACADGQPQKTSGSTPAPAKQVP